MSPYNQRPDWRRFYNTRAWRELRAAQLLKEPLCAYCAKTGAISNATVADHKTPHRGSAALFFDPANLQSLCKLCHDKAKQRLERTGHLIGNGLDGVPLDPRHHWHG